MYCFPPRKALTTALFIPQSFRASQLLLTHFPRISILLHLCSLVSVFVTPFFKIFSFYNFALPLSTSRACLCHFLFYRKNNRIILALALRHSSFTLGEKMCDVDKVAVVTK